MRGKPNGELASSFVPTGTSSAGAEALRLLNLSFSSFRPQASTATPATSRVQRNSLPSTHMRCRTTPSRRASATLARFFPCAYAAHAAWLEDHRGQGNGALADRLIGRALAAPVSRTWKAYWRQRVA